MTTHREAWLAGVDARFGGLSPCRAAAGRRAPPPLGPRRGVRDVPVTPPGALAQINFSATGYRLVTRFELDVDTVIDRWYFTINGEGANIGGDVGAIGTRTGYGAGDGGTWRGDIVACDPVTGLPTATVLAGETVDAATAHLRAMTEFGLSEVHQVHWVDIPPTLLAAGNLYAFALRNTDPSPGTGGGNTSSGNHMSANLNWTQSLAELGPNGRNTLDPTEPGATCGLTPREAVLWSPNGGTTWEVGDRVGWYDIGNGQGRTWPCGYRVAGGLNVPHGWPYVNWPADVAGPVTVTYRGAPRAVTLARAGGSSKAVPVGIITVRNTATGAEGTTPSLGAGLVAGPLTPPVPVAAGQAYTVSAAGTVSVGSPTSGHGAVFGLGSRVPWNVSSTAPSSRVPMLYAGPHPFHVGAA